MNKVMAENLKALRLNNAARVRELFRYGNKSLKTVFKKVPLLIQANHPDLPGYMDHGEAPRGIWGLDYHDLVRQAREAFPGIKADIENRLYVDAPLVESLILIGSSGSVGQTTASDLDYWVCLDRRNISVREMDILTRKLNLISQWAMKRHSVEVNFYTVDTADLAENRLERHGRESEGEVAPLLLKEELYRTLLHVAGRFPLWWTAPLTISPKQYLYLVQSLNKQTDKKRLIFIDLGFPLNPPPQEYLSAALWLSQKSHLDPFKGLLKMILILEQVENGLAAPLLCQQIKSAILDATRNELPIDPYAMTIRRVLAFSAKYMNPAARELVRISAYFKIIGPFDQGKTDRPQAKIQLIEQLMAEWQWDRSKVEQLDNFTSWSERERLNLGHRMKTMLFTLYSRIAKKLMQDYPDQVDAGGKGLTQFRANILTRFSRHQAVVENLPSSLHSKTLPKTMTLFYNGRKWQLYGGAFEQFQAGSDSSIGRLIKQFPRAAGAAAWLVHNRLFDPELKLRLRPRPGPVSLETMLELLKKLNDIFPPMDFAQSKKGKKWRLGGKGPRLVIVNLEDSWHQHKLVSTDLIYRTAWGEMRHTCHDLIMYENEADKYVALAKILQESGEIGVTDLNLFAPVSALERKITGNLRVALNQALAGVTKRKKGVEILDEKTRLDMD